MTMPRTQDFGTLLAVGTGGLRFCWVAGAIPIIFLFFGVTLEEANMLPVRHAT